jgi:hypothetical protein
MSDRGLADWKPNAHTLTILADILGVLRENRDEWPVDARSIEYALLDRGYRKHLAQRTDQPASPKSREWERRDGKSRQGTLYMKVIEVLARGRRAGLVPWDAIADNAYRLSEPDAFTSPAAFLARVREAAAGYERPLLRFQPIVPELWVEARGMVDRVDAIAHEYGVRVWSSGGMDHLEAKHRLALSVVDRAREGRCTVVLHIGDHDKAGRTVFRVLAEDVAAMAEDTEANAGGYVAFHRLWITEPQAWELHDLGKSQGLDADGLPEVQAEAVPIADRPAMIRAAILARINVPLYERVRDRGLAERGRIIERVSPRETAA